MILVLEQFAGTESANVRNQIRADAINGSVRIFGSNWSSHDLHWNLDPVSGQRWPTTASHAIDYRHEELLDPKWAWEVNRLLFLLPFATSSGGDERERLAADRFAASVITSWIHNNPVGAGIAWTASIEVAIRVIVLNTLYKTFLSGGGDSNTLKRSLSDHVDWIKRFPSRYSSANNHRVAELSALLILDSSWSGLLPSSERDAAEQELVAVMRSLFAADGIGTEQSPTYAGFTLELAAMAYAAHPWQSVSLAEDLKRIAASATAALVSFSDERGQLIRYGDDDEGKVLSSCISDSEYVEFIGAIWGLSIGQPRLGVQSFVEGGHTILRYRDLPEAETIVTFDHAPLGFGAIAAHGHADALHVSIRAGGVTWIADAGTYRYHGNKEWRRYFRSSAAHNAPRLKDGDSSIMTGDFNWHPRLRASAKLVELVASGENCTVVAEHDGYEKQGLVAVRRTVQRKSRGSYSIIDESQSASPIVIETGFLIPAVLKVEELLPRGWRISSEISDYALDIVPSAGRTSTESPEQEKAWISETFGSKHAAWRLSTSANTQVGSPLIFELNFHKVAR